MGDITKDFSYDEVRCKCGCGNANISLPLMHKVQTIRSILDIPLTVNSGVRCAEHNKAEGGADDSEHVPTETLPGEGIDIKCNDSSLRWKLIQYGQILFDRVGDGDGFVHFGVRETKKQERLWNYY